MAGEDVLQPGPEGFYAHFALVKGVPRSGHGKEFLFDGVSSPRAIKKLRLTRVAQKVPPKLQSLSSTRDEIDDGIFGAWVDEVWLCQDAKGAISLGIEIFSLFNDLFIGDVGIAGDDREHHRPWIGHVLSDHLIHQCNVLLGGDTLCRPLEGPRHVDDTEVFLRWTSNLQNEDVPRESPSSPTHI